MQKAIKLGGIVNPSVAVIDSDKQTHRGYGEISLILRPETIDGQDTYIGDAWTETFPHLTPRLSEEGEEQIKEDVRSVHPDMKESVVSNLRLWAEGEYCNEETI